MKEFQKMSYFKVTWQFSWEFTDLNSTIVLIILIF